MADRLAAQAALARIAAGEHEAGAELLRTSGADIVVAGGAQIAIAAIRALPAELRDEKLRLVLGQALTVVGENDAALAELEALAGEATGPDGRVPAAIAWRLGAVHYQRADPDAAIAAMQQGRLDRCGTRDEALLLAQSAIVRWSTGHRAECAALGQRALRTATVSGDDQALAAAHVALALHAVLAGDRAGNAQHYANAIRFAEQGGDAIQLARIHLNQVSMLLEEGRYREAVAASGPALAAARACGHTTIEAVALLNEADGLVRLARLDEAEARYQEAISTYQRIGSRMVSYPLAALGAVHARRGQRSLARAAFEEAIRTAEPDGLQQALIPALYGLARLLATEESAAARAIAARATAAATGPSQVPAQLAEGWVAYACGDIATARRAAVTAAEAARQHRDRAGLAEALELHAVTCEAADEVLEALREAERTWTATGSMLDAARLSVQIGQHTDASIHERLAARHAQATLEAAGVTARTTPAPPASPVPQIVIRALGRFEVQVDGVTLGPADWQSRKARDLLRILAARRGRSVARDELSALLWADDNHVQRVSHRLSVALSTLRSLLDPNRAAPADYYVAATAGGLRLDLSHLTVDVETFFHEAELGLHLNSTNKHAEAHFALASAARIYLGEFCQDEPYEDWTAQLREEARVVYLRVNRTLAELCLRRGQVDDAAGHLRRVLQLDPYDEECHRELVDLYVAAGRHGEAQRARARYQAAMTEIGVGL